MTLLFPLGLAALASLPILIWLWRHAASTYQTNIPSLVPFANLLRRPPRRRTRLVTNLLFWLQAALLTLLAAALAEPMWHSRRIRTTLIVLDTSASMEAKLNGPSAFERAMQDVSRRLGRVGVSERVLVMRTAPVGALTDSPTNDPGVLSEALRQLRPADEGGNLATAARIGQALLGASPDRLLIVTDEPVPSTSRTGEAAARDPSTPIVHSVGVPLPNVAIVGVDAYEPLCAPQARPARLGTSSAASLMAPNAPPAAGTHMVATIQNFSDTAQRVSATLRQEGRRVAQLEQEVPPNARVPVSFDLPPEASGVFEISVKAPRDALQVDNRAWVTIRGHATIPVAVEIEDEALRSVVGRWLDACPRLDWQPRAPDQPSSAALLMTDREHDASAWPSASIVFAPRPPTPRVIAMYWAVDTTHPIGMYLDPLSKVATPLSASSLAELTADAPPSQTGIGEPVIWGIAAGRKVPLVSLASRGERRTVRIWFDPTRTPNAVPMVLVFFNSVRWVLGAQGFAVTGEPLTVGPFAPGLVRIETPHGATWRSHDGGLLRYEATSEAGRYRFLQGTTTIERMVNFLDPVESNTMQRVSTWEADAIKPAAGSPTSSATMGSRAPTSQSVVGNLLWLAFVLCLVEWVGYVVRKRHKHA